MEHKLINTGYYMLIVDDSEIKKETYCYDSINNILVFYKGSMKNIGFQKVISHLPLNNSPILEGVILLPPLEDQHKDQLLKAVLYSTNRETVMSTLNNMVKIPVGFKCEMVQKKPKHTDYGVLISFDNEPFTVVNTQGLTQWVGEYIY